MKNTCSLNNCRAADYSLNVKRDICCACIDDDHIDCREGALNINAYKNQLEEENKRKKKLIAVILLAQEELKRDLKNNEINEETRKKNLIGAVQLAHKELKQMENDLGIHRQRNG